MKASLALTASAPAHAALDVRTPPGERLVPSVQRAMALLDRLAQQREPMSLARLVAELSLPKSSVHGLCNTLLSLGYLHRQSDGAFRIGPRVMTLAGAFVAGTGVAREFNALWEPPGAALEETVVLSVLSGTEVVYIGVHNGDRPLGLAFSVGMRLPAHLAATGKAQLANLPVESVRESFDGVPLTPLTRHGPRRLGTLLSELEQTLERGYAIDDEGVREGVYCIAAPVFDATARAVAGVGVCVHKSMLGSDGGARHRDALLRIAQQLSQRLGGTVPPLRAPTAARHGRRKSS
jgi:IclR family transcriptional regulator, blcABC operon repressor